MDKSENHRRLDYVEMPSTDLPATRAFFGDVFGWSFSDYGPTYTAFNDGRMDGGFFSREEASPVGGALIVLYSTDLEKTLEEVKRGGGSICKEIFAFPGGRRFQFKEPGGNELGVWGD